MRNSLLLINGKKFLFYFPLGTKVLQQQVSKLVVALIFILCMFSSLSAQTIKTVGTGGDYSTLTAAFSAIGTLSGAVELQIISDISEAGTPILAWSTNYSSLKIYPTGAARTISLLTPITINSANVTIDGTIGGGGSGPAGLSIKGSAVTVNTGIVVTGLSVANSVTGFTIKNCNIYDFLNTAINIGTFVNTCTISNNSIYNDWAGTVNNVLQFGICVSNIPSAPVFAPSTYGLTISGNYIGGSLPLCGGTAWTRTAKLIRAIYLNGQNSIAATNTIQGNTIQNITSGVIGINEGIHGIEVLSGNTSTNTTTNIDGNVFSNLVLPASGTQWSELWAICNNNGGTTSNSGIILNITNNQINTFTNNDTQANGFTTGIYLGSTIPLINITNNTIHDLFCFGSYPLSGIECHVQLSTGSVISQNKIYTLYNKSTSGNGTVTGITANMSGTASATSRVTGNKIYDLNLTLGYGTAIIQGINIIAGSSTYDNNMISLGTNVASDCIIKGIVNNTVGSNNYVYYNSIYIEGGSASLNQVNYSCALQKNVNLTGTNTEYVKNNIIVNDRITSANNNFAVFLNNTGGMDLENNNYYVGGSNKLVSINGQTCNTLPILTNETDFLNVPVTFADVTTANLDITDNAIQTSLAGSGIPLTVSGSVAPATTINDDFDNITSRSTTNPTIGANEFTITAAQPVTQASNLTITNVSSSGFTASCRKGPGTFRTVWVTTDLIGTASPIDGTTYTANTVYTSVLATKIGNWSCVYKGLGNLVNVSGLSPGTPYQVMVCEHNGFGGYEKYQTITSGANLLSMNTTTADAVTVSSSGGSTSASYGTLFAAFAAINAGTHQGAITVTINRNLLETQSCVLKSGTIVPASYTSVLITPSDATEKVITGLNIIAPLVDLVGASNVTINGQYNGSGMYLRFRLNTDIATVSVIRFNGDASFNAVKYCYIEGGSGSNGTNNASLIIGASTAVTGNDNITIDNCSFLTTTGKTNVACILLDGTAAKTNDNITISNCNLADFNTNGLQLANAIGTGVVINNNSIYCTFNSSTNQVGMLLGQSSLAGDLTIHDNYIGGSAPNALGTWYKSAGSTFNGINATMNSGTNKTILQKNTIKNIYALNCYATFNGITNTSIGNYDILANTISDFGSDASTIFNVNFYGLNMGSTGTININKNYISRITINSTSANQSFGCGMYINAIGKYTINNNIIHDITSSSIRGSGSQIAAGIYMNTASALLTPLLITGNTVYNIAATWTGDARVFGIYVKAPATGTNLISFNTIYNIVAPSSSGSNGIHGLEAAAGSATYSNNMISLGTGISGDANIMGLYKNCNTPNNFYYNSVYIGGTVASGTRDTYAFKREAAQTALNDDLRNNLFFNARNGGTGKPYTINIVASSFLTSDYNELFSSNPAYTCSSNATTPVPFATWQTNNGDSHSLNIPVAFVSSSSNLRTFESQLKAKGNTVDGLLNNDIDNQTRPSPPSIGAFEITNIPMVVTTVPTAVTTTTATLGGTITDNGISTSESGVIYGLLPNPSVDDNSSINLSTSGLITAGSFTFPVKTALIAGTTYNVRAYVANNLTTPATYTYGDNLTFTPAGLPQLSALSTVNITTVTASTATIEASSIADDGNGTTGNGGVTTCGIVYGTSTGVLIGGTDVINVPKSPMPSPVIIPFNSAMASLTAGTIYYVKSYAINSNGIGYSNEVSFYTPVNVTTTFNDATTQSASILGTIVNNDSPISESGVVYSLTTGVDINNGIKVVHSPLVTTGEFTSVINGLIPSTKYYVKAYATSPLSTIYGTEQPITTSAVTIPVIQATNLQFTNIKLDQVDMSWTIGSGEKHLVFAFLGNNSTSATPVDAITYTANPAFPFGTQIDPTTGWYCVYNGTGSSITVTGLTKLTNYRFKVLEANGSAGYENYLGTDDLVSPNIASVTTIDAYAPAIQATSIVASDIQSNKLDLAWTNGDGSKRSVFIYQGTTGNPIPVDGTIYTAGAYSVNQIDASGWYCVYNGNGANTTISGLSPATDYLVKVCEMNGSLAADIKYFKDDATGNPYKVITDFVPPTAQATNILFSNVTSSKMDLSWTNAGLGGGIKRAVFIHQGNSSAPAPINNNTYIANTTFATGDQIALSGWYCVYNEVGTGVTVTGLTPNTNYQVMVLEYNGTIGKEKYYTATANGNSANKNTLFARPVAQASNISFSNITAYKANVGVDNIGNGTQRAIFITSGTTGSVLPLDNITYTANPVFGSGSLIGGWYCIYNGTTSSVNITGLSPITGYRVMVCEYNGTPGNEQYLTTGVATNNPMNFISDIIKTDQSISFANIPTHTYGEGTISLTASATSGLPLSYLSSNPAIATVIGSTVTIKGAGSTQITASQSGDISHNLATDVSQTLNIIPKVLTVTGALAANKIYDRTIGVVISGATLVGVVNTDAVSLDNAMTGTFGSAAVANGKEVSTSMSLSGVNAGNYSLTQPSLNTADITPVSLTVTGALTANKVYDGNTNAVISGATLVGVLDNDAVSLNNATIGTFTLATVGNGKSVASSMSLNGANSLNYTLTQPSLSTANITPAVLTVTGALAANKVYNGNTNAVISGAALNGMINNDVLLLANNITGIFVSATTGTGKGVTTSMTFSGTNSGNYTLIQPTLTANITPITLTVTGTVASNKAYDRTTVAAISGATLVGVVSPDAILLANASTGKFTSANVGNGIGVTASMTLSGTNSGNYALIQPTINAANITPVVLTVTGASATKVYDGTISGAISGATLVGVISPDVVSLVNATTCEFDMSTVGNGKPVTTSMSLSGANYGNYTLTQPTLTGNITPLPLNVTGALATSKAYDGTTSAVITGATLAISPYAVSLANAVTGTFASATTGNGKTVTTSMTLNGDNSGNYSLIQPVLLANITRIPLTVIGVTGQKRVYGAANPTLNITYSGLLLGELATSVVTTNPTVSCTAILTSPLGNYPITISGGAATNYYFVYNNTVNMAVTLSPQTITFPDFTDKSMNDADFAPASSSSGLDVTYTSSNLAVATIVNGKIHVVGNGKTNITASQAGDANYSPAVVVVKELQVIITGTPSPLTVECVLSPNPVADVLSIIVSSQFVKKVTVSIFTEFGKMMWFQKITETHTYVDMNNFAPGFYLVKISNGTDIITKKIIKM